MIPDEAIEAVTKVLVAHQRRDNSSCLCGWARLGFSHPTHQAALVLEAAALHLMAQAWDEGWDAFAGFDSRPGGPYPANPWRRRG